MSIALFLFVAAAIGWPLAIFAAPIAGAWGSVPYVLGSLVCHQIPERSFHIAGVQLPVCARCTGLYLGAALAALGSVIVGVRRFGRSADVRETRTGSRRLTRARTRNFLIVAALPTIATAASNALGWWDPPNATRAVLAAPLGFAVCAVVAATLAGELW